MSKATPVSDAEFTKEVIESTLPVVVDFWATWCGPCRQELPNLISVYKKYEQEPRFAIVSLSLDQKMETAERFVQDKGMGWTHGFLGGWKETDVPESYGVQGIPAMFLIDPEGKIVATGLRGSNLGPAIEKVLASTPK